MASACLITIVAFPLLQLYYSISLSYCQYNYIK
nr:MAG TPA: hypothetical protein [Caudoviricetes sp.]